jgi:hypothetical protein
MSGEGQKGFYRTQGHSRPRVHMVVYVIAWLAEGRLEWKAKTSTVRIEWIMMDKSERRT